MGEILSQAASSHPHLVVFSVDELVLKCVTEVIVVKVKPMVVIVNPHPPLQSLIEINSPLSLPLI